MESHEDFKQTNKKNYPQTCFPDVCCLSSCLLQNWDKRLQGLSAAVRHTACIFVRVHIFVFTILCLPPMF